MQRNSYFPSARFLFGLSFCLIALQVAAVPQVLPDAVAHAHTVFLVNETGFNELGYSTVFELNKWGRLDLADSPENADLIMRLDNGNHVRLIPEGQVPSSGGANTADDSEIPKGQTRVSLLDPKTNAVLWSGTHKTEGGKVKNGGLLDGLREAFKSYEKSRR
jgi:hypothetical protein